MKFGVYYKNKLQLNTTSASSAVNEAKVLSSLMKDFVFIKTNGEIVGKFKNGKIVK